MKPERIKNITLAHFGEVGPVYWAIGHEGEDLLKVETHFRNADPEAGQPLVHFIAVRPRQELCTRGSLEAFLPIAIARMRAMTDQQQRKQEAKYWASMGEQFALSVGREVHNIAEGKL